VLPSNCSIACAWPALAVLLSAAFQRRKHPGKKPDNDRKSSQPEQQDALAAFYCGWTDFACSARQLFMEHLHFI
jgi:hypothetical protein